MGGGRGGGGGGGGGAKLQYNLFLSRFKPCTRNTTTCISVAGPRTCIGTTESVPASGSRTFLGRK